MRWQVIDWKASAKNAANQGIRTEDRQMNAKKRIAAIVAAMTMALCAGIGGSAKAAGLLIADGGFGGVLEIEEHDVRVVVNNGVAVTHVTQVFRNTEKRQVEALYTFPVPKGASVANFSMWINGKEMVGEVLEKERAREIYNSYKQRRRDPGLLEQKDYKTFEMRIFPIAAEAKQKVCVTYYQELEVDNDWLTYVYPLATTTRKDIDNRTAGRFAINLELRSAVPIAEMKSPSHSGEFVVARHADTYGQASLESKGGSLARDVVLACRLSRPRTGIDVVTSREPGEDGYFLMTVTAGEDLGKLDTPMDYVFVMDISGSMGHDEKLATSKKSVEAFIEALDDGDRFEVMTFNVKPTALFSSLTPATVDNVGRAVDFLSGQAARGGTILRPAMSAAYRYSDPDRSLNVVILSDGMTEQKERQQLLQLISSRPRNCRVFCIGVGNEVNRPLLQQIARDSGGLAAFVSRGDDFNRQARAFRRKLTKPVATDLKIDFGGLQVHDVEPSLLPNLYHGSPIRVYGRYRGEGEPKVTLTGDIRGVEFRSGASLRFRSRDADNPEIERMWASHRIDNLLKRADRSGSRSQVLDEVVGLGESFSIVTEYTSFLVLENDGEYKRWKIDRRNASRIARDRRAQAARDKLLGAIRDKAAQGIGPAQPNRVAAARPTTAATRVPAQTAAPAKRVTAPAATRRPGQSWDLDLGIGTGPVGPLFLLLTGWLRLWGTRRRKRR